jgi:hypothetical protein
MGDPVRRQMARGIKPLVSRKASFRMLTLYDMDRMTEQTNWLLIKHRDEHAREGDADAVLTEDRSIASGRPMAAIAAKKGRGPKPFMLAGKAAAERAPGHRRGRLVVSDRPTRAKNRQSHSVELRHFNSLITMAFRGNSRTHLQSFLDRGNEHMA